MKTNYFILIPKGKFIFLAAQLIYHLQKNSKALWLKIQRISSISLHPAVKGEELSIKVL